MTKKNQERCGKKIMMLKW